MTDSKNTVRYVCPGNFGQTKPAVKICSRDDMAAVAALSYFGAPLEVGVYAVEISKGCMALFAPTSQALEGVSASEKRAWAASHNFKEKGEEEGKNL